MQNFEKIDPRISSVGGLRPGQGISAFRPVRSVSGVRPGSGFFSSVEAKKKRKSSKDGKRLSYLTPDRTKPITARKRGDDFERAAVLAVLEQNAARTAEKAAAISSTCLLYTSTNDHLLN